MTDSGVPLHWRIIVVPFVAVTVLLMVLGELRGGPLLSSTALVALPVAFAVCAAAFAYLRHREHVDPGGSDQRLRGREREGERAPAP